MYDADPLFHTPQVPPFTKVMCARSEQDHASIARAGRHFFDVVHGTRHDFFMSEYRSNYDLQWIQLLLARGFDPAKVEKEHRNLLFTVVD